GADGAVGLLHPLIDDGAELGHFEERFARNLVGGDVLLDGFEFRGGGGIDVAHAIDAAEDFRKVDRLDTDAVVLQNLFAVADRVEGRRPRANGSDAEPAHAANHTANSGKPIEVFAENVAIGGFGMPGGERIGNAVLHQVVAGAHLAAEAVAAVADGHQARRIGGRLHQDGNVQAGHAEGVGNGALIAEIGERDDNAGYFGGMLFEEVGTAGGLGARFDGAVLGFFRSDADGPVAGCFDGGDHFSAPGPGQVIREETSVPCNNAEGYGIDGGVHFFFGANLME